MLSRKAFRKPHGVRAVHLSVPGLVQEPSGQVQTADATAVAAAPATAATADPPVEELAEIEPESQQQQHRQQDIHELVDDAEQTILAGFAGAGQRGAGGGELALVDASPVDAVDVSASRRDGDRRQRGQQQPDDPVAAADTELESTATVVLSAGDESDPSRGGVRFHLELGGTRGQPQPIRRSGLQRLCPGAVQRRLLSGPDPPHASQSADQLSSSAVPSQYDPHLVYVVYASDQPSSEPGDQSVSGREQ